MSNTQLQLCSFEQAKSLKELGFLWPTHDAIEIKTKDKYGTNCGSPQLWGDLFIATPTIPHAFMWLREVKRIFCEVQIYPEGWEYTLWDIPVKTILINGSCGAYDTFQQAESAALDAAIDYLKQK